MENNLVTDPVWMDPSFQIAKLQGLRVDIITPDGNVHHGSLCLSWKLPAPLRYSVRFACAGKQCYLTLEAIAKLWPSKNKWRADLELSFQQKPSELHKQTR